MTNPNTGVSTLLPDGTIDGRLAADDNDVRATGYNRPENIVLQTLRDGTQLLYFATTDSDNNGTGVAAGGGLRNADNLAIDHEGNIYIVEDRNGGSDDDIWFAADWNKDGDLLDEGEGLARWVSNRTAGSEFTDLYFDLRNPNRAFVNIQHPSSGVGRTIEIAPSPQFQTGNKN